MAPRGEIMDALFGKIGKLCNADAEWALAVRARQIHLLGRWACNHASCRLSVRARDGPTPTCNGELIDVDGAWLACCRPVT